MPRIFLAQKIQQAGGDFVEDFAAAMHDAHGPVQFGGFETQRYKTPLPNVLAHHTGRHDADSRSVRHGFLDHLDIVESKDDLNRNFLLPEITIDLFLNR